MKMKNFFKIKTKNFKSPFNNCFFKESTNKFRNFSNITLKMKKIKSIKQIMSLVGCGIGITTAACYFSNNMAQSKSMIEFPYDPSAEEYSPALKYPILFNEYDGQGNRTEEAYATPENRFYASIIDLFIFCGIPFLIARFIAYKYYPNLRIYLQKIAAVTGIALYTLSDLISTYKTSFGKKFASLIIVDEKTNLRASYLQVIIKTLIDSCGFSVFLLYNFLNDYPRQIITIGGTVGAFNLFNLLFLITHGYRTLGGKKRKRKKKSSQLFFNCFY